MDAIPYIDTMGSHKYKDMVQQPFIHKDIPKLFKDWINTEYYQYDKPNDKLFDRVKFYFGYYTINSNEYRLPLPKTINDFISDLNRCNINVQWNEEIINKMNIRDYYKQTEIKKFYNSLLKQLDKLNEIL
jgi:hypothetical protein